MNLDANDVKSKLFDTLKSRGVLDSLKSQLRTKLIYELQDSTGVPLLSSSVKQSFGKGKEESDTLLCKKIVNNLIAEHLKLCKYEYTLSTFLPESGSTIDKLLTIRNILSLLHVNEESQLYKNLENTLGCSTDNKGFLWQFLLEISALHNKVTHDVETQTEKNYTQSLEEKILNVENEFAGRIKSIDLNRKQGIEEKLIAVQKQYEIQKKKELEDEIKKFKASEISKLRLEEREKYELKIKKIQAEYDQEFRVKSDALRAMEKETLENLKRLQEDKEVGAYRERQKILEEMSSVKERENELRNKIELHKRTQKFEEEKLAKEAERLNLLEETLRERGTFYEERIKAETEMSKRNYQQQLSMKENELMRRELKLETERREIEVERETYLNCQEDLNCYKERNHQLQTLIGNWESRFEKLHSEKAAVEEKLFSMGDYKSLKEQGFALEKEVEYLTQLLEEARKQQKGHEKNDAKNLRGTTEGPSKDVLKLRKEIREIKEKCKQRVRLSNEGKKMMESKLSAAVQRANHFQILYEEQVSRQKLLEDEIVHFRTIQQQTEQLLSMDIRHQEAVELPQPVVLREKNSLEYTRNLSKKLDSDNSCLTNESSIASLVENKRIFQNLEREAEALDASYRDFQSRMRHTQSHIDGDIPSVTNFHRLPSFHSLHKTKDSWVKLSTTVPRFNPLPLYDEPGIKPFQNIHKQRNQDLKTNNAAPEHVESPVDESAPLTVKDLKNKSRGSIDDPPPQEPIKRNRKTNGRDNSDNFSVQISISTISDNEQNARKEQTSTTGNVSRVELEEDSFHNSLAERPGTGKSNTLTDGRSMPANVSYRKLSREYQSSASNVGVALDNSGGDHLRDVSVGELSRTNFNLDMEELEKRRQKERSFSIPDSKNSRETKSDSSYISQHDHGPEVRLASITGNAEASERRTQDTEVVVDPLMSKYMEMIKQRRDSEGKERNSEKQSDMSAENDDEEVSIGKLSDGDFNWE